MAPPASEERHVDVGNEHLLLGMLRNDRDRTVRMLDGLGITHDAV